MRVSGSETRGREPTRCDRMALRKPKKIYVDAQGNLVDGDKPTSSSSVVRVADRVGVCVSSSLPCHSPPPVPLLLIAFTVLLHSSKIEPSF